MVFLEAGYLPAAFAAEACPAEDAVEGAFVVAGAAGFAVAFADPGYVAAQGYHHLVEGACPAGAFVVEASAGPGCAAGRGY
jgi:hypothetical protein